MTEQAQNHPSLSSGVRFVAPAAFLGGGYSRRALRDALAAGLDFIACDGGSTDWGPSYLGTATSWAGEGQTRRDLEPMIVGALDHDIPLLIGTAGFTGSTAGLDWFRGLVEDILTSLGRRATVATIYSEVATDWIEERIRAGRVKALDGQPDLTADMAREATRVVAMMGPEPIHEALSQGAQIVLAGRCSDAAVYAAVPLQRGVDPGAAWHMGKTVECGYAIADPIGAGECILGSVDDEGFSVRPVGGKSRCTPQSVAAQMLYENANPFLLREPPGTLDTEHAVYDQVDPHTVRVTGAAFQDEPYSVRLEGVRQVGYRSICLFGIRDPAVVAAVEDYTARITDLVHATAHQRYGLEPDDYTFGFRRYGYDAVLGEAEPMKAAGHPGCYEIGLVAEAIATTQEKAHELVSGAMPFFMHGVRVEGVKNSANGALAFAPSVIDVGPVFEWSVWHAAELDDPLDPFTVVVADLPAVEVAA